MSVSILIDMNLSPDWAQLLERAGIPAIHWTAIGDIRASDRQIMEWAAAHQHAVFTHDLDFGAILALTGRGGPSVIQLRAQDVAPALLVNQVAATIRANENALERGALVVISPGRNRVRILPISPPSDENR